ncbi:M14 family metallopeptidase [Alkalimonas sp.]|uniref:M14 family metallopeptidase n=1 Tax=Alkalimonas sp. TaxID=1872453 RepID=UPI00263A9336|nr:M14 family metallopeptidase [Alkalimonas sp.]MCC5825093.1 succinylglutamate desuccinylase/aspartoacylase family protein [Alkalimonas sp.]
MALKTRTAFSLWKNYFLLLLLCSVSASALAEETCEFEQVSFDASFPTGRLTSCLQLSEQAYRIVVSPAFMPVNPSAWYAFRVRAERAIELDIEIEFSAAFARYSPKLMMNDQSWQEIPHEKTERTISFSLAIPAQQSQYIAAQPIFDNSYYEAWFEQVSVISDAEIFSVGFSEQDNELKALQVSPENSLLLLIIGRQHPPEVTGAFALSAFVERLLENEPLAEQFRKLVNIVVIPQVNPDGVQAGKWRHNSRGIDLNRDWHQRSQQETQNIHQFIVGRHKNHQQLVFALDFHSTNRNVYYTMPAEKELFWQGLTKDWLADLSARIPYDVIDAPSDRPENGVFKQYIADYFFVQAVTYEVGDETPIDEIQKTAHAAAEALMLQILSRANE